MKIQKYFKKIEHGRSMVEMLGVLAIIGVLSLGSVWLYDYASKFYEANHIQDSIAKAKSLADVNQSSTHIREVERLLRQTLGQYNPQIQQMEIRNSSEGKKMTNVITLQDVNERVCQIEFTKQDVFESINVFIMEPTSVDGCTDGTNMIFSFDTIRTDIICENDSDCTGTNNPFCKKGQCVPCEPSDCSGTEPVCNKETGACEKCSNNAQCSPDYCAGNGSCGECSSNEHCTNEFKPICDTYEGICKPCATDGDCEPKYCAGNGTCGDCSAHPHCPNTKPKCDSELGVCKACPTGTYWHTSLQKCTECTQNTHCTNDLMPICNTGTGVCEPCSNNAQCSPDYCAGNGSCGDCSAHEHCPSNKPKCDTQKGICEACPSSAPVWNASQGKCITCAASNSATPHWNGTKCVSCLDNSHCNGNTPVCNASNTCEACPSATPYWNGTKCVSCLNNSHCSGNTPVCNASNTCKACPSATPYWNGSQCITCTAFNSATPVWNATQKKCISCYASNSAKPYWNGTTCTTCPTTTPVWNTSQNKCVECLQDSDCNISQTCDVTSYTCIDKNCSNNNDCDPGQFCKTTGCSAPAYCTIGWCDGVEHYDKGVCETPSYYTFTKNSKTYYISKSSNYNWWSAERFCKSINANMVPWRDSLYFSEIKQYHDIAIWWSATVTNGGKWAYMNGNYAQGVYKASQQCRDYSKMVLCYK